MKFFLIFILVLMHGKPAFAADAMSTEATGHLKKAQTCMQEDDYECAGDELRKVLAERPDLPQVHNLLGMAYAKQEGFIQSAIAEYEEAAALDAHYAEPYFNLGTLHAGTLQDPEAALDYFEKALRADPGYARANFAMAWIYLFEKKDRDKALALFKSSVERMPKLAEAYYGMALCYLQLNKRELALEPISRMRELNREDLASKIESFMQTGDLGTLAKRPAPGAAPAPGSPGAPAPPPAVAPAKSALAPGS